MIKQEFEKFFRLEKSLSQENMLDDGLISNMDNIILNSIDESTFNQEVLLVYKKFIPMKQNAPENMKNELFRTIRNYAQEQFEQKNWTEALILYRFLLSKSILIPQDYANIAYSLIEIKAKDIAKSIMYIYEKKEQNRLLMLITLAEFYKNKLCDYKNAIKYYEKFLEIDKTKSVIYSILGDLYSKVYSDESLDIQISYFEQANSLKPNNRLNLHGLAFAYEKLENNEKADYYYKLLLKNNPTEIDYLNYGMFLIHTGKIYEGHRYFTHRFLINDKNLKYPIENAQDKRWDLKSDISDKILLIHYEQGFGDTLMYCRFVPFMQKFAKKIIFVVQDEIYDLVSTSPIMPEKIEIISNKTALSTIKYDYSMALLDTPYVLKTQIQTIPYCDKYLDVQSEKITQYAKNNINENSKIKIGIAYSGDISANYNERNIDLEKFKLLKDIPNVEFYSLQKDTTEDYGFIKSLGPTFKTFTDTACAIKNMDIIISTDNVILNLSGALGIKTIGLFNKYTNFRWYKIDKENIGWYNTVKGLQAQKQNNWSEVFSQLINLISEIKK